MYNAAYSDLEQIYDEHADMMYRIALSHLGSAQDAEDAVHDVFLKLADDCPSFKNDEHLKAWIIRAVVNRSVDLLRRRNTRQHISLEDNENIIIEKNAEPSGVISLVYTLPDIYKSVIILHYLEGYSVDEIAGILKISKSAVKMRLMRGREVLKQNLNKEN